MPKQNNRMKFQDQLQKFMHKKAQAEQGMQVEKHPFLLEEVLLMDQKVNLPIKRKLNKSEKRLSVASLITEKNKNKNLLFLSNFDKEIKKTKDMFSIIKKFEITNSLIVVDKNSKIKIEKSVRNIPNVKLTDVNHFSAFDIIKFKKIVFTESSIKELEKRYS